MQTMTIEQLGAATDAGDVEDVTLEGLAAEIQDALDDPRPNISHDDLMAEIDANITALAAEHKSAKKTRV